jgi:hypothetical protein
MKKSNSRFINRLKQRILSADQFGQKVELNLNGDSTINSIFGSIVSLIIYLTIVGYGLYRL